MASILDESLARGVRTVFDQNEEHVLAGLALLGMDYYLYLQPQSVREDSVWFIETVEAVRQEEAKDPKIGDFAYPDYKTPIAKCLLAVNA